MNADFHQPHNSYSGTYIFLDDRCVPESEAVVSVFSRGLQYGDGLFETVRVSGGSPCFLENHIQRLFSGLSVIGIEPAFSPDHVRSGVLTLTGQTSLREAVLKIIVFRDVAASSDPSADARCRLVMFVRPFDTVRFQRCSRGISAWIATARRNCMSPLVSLKSLNYLENIIARREAKAHGADEALFLNIHGFLAEGATSNIFIVQKGSIVTPPEHAGILPGIMRDAVIMSSGKLGVPCAIRDITRDDLLCADEAFCTNAIMGIMPLMKVNGSCIGPSRPGQITLALQQSISCMLGDCVP